MKAITCTSRGERKKGLFVTDLDGTLLNNQKEISRGDLQALYRLREEGYISSIATGRSNYSFNKLMTTLGCGAGSAALPIDYVIFSTGAGIMDFPDTSVLKSYSLTGDDVRQLTDYLDCQSLDYMVHNPVPDTRSFLYRYTGSHNPDFLARLKLYHDFARPVSPVALMNSCGATELLCIAPENVGHQLAEQLAGDLKQYSVIKATSPLDNRSVWIEIFARDVSKSRAVAWLGEVVNIARENICAVGNDYNDEDLLQWANRGFVVANAPRSLKERFMVVASNEGEGVRQAIDSWLTEADFR